jgi:hypothetical protein
MEPDTNGVRGIPKQNTASFLSSDTVYFRGFKGRIRNEIALTPLDSSAITHEYRTNALLRILKGASGTNVWMKHGTDTASTNQAFMSLMLPCLQPTKEQVVRKDYPAVVTHVSWATPEEAGSDAHINGKQVQNLVICDDLPTGSYLCVGNKVYGVNALKQAFQPHGNKSYFIDPFERVGALSQSPSYVGSFDEQGQFTYNPLFKKAYDKRLKNPVVKEYETLLKSHLDIAVAMNAREVKPFSADVQHILVHPDWTPAQYEEYINDLVKTYGKSVPNTGLILHGSRSKALKTFQNNLEAKGFHVWHMQSKENKLSMLPRVAEAKLGILIRLLEHHDASKKQATVQQFMNTDLKGESIPLYLAQSFSYCLPKSADPNARWFVATGCLNENVIKNQVKANMRINIVGTGNGHLPAQKGDAFFEYLKGLQNPMTMYAEPFNEIPNMTAYEIGKNLLKTGIKPAKESIQRYMGKLARQIKP